MRENTQLLKLVRRMEDMGRKVAIVRPFPPFRDANDILAAIVMPRLTDQDSARMGVAAPKVAP